MLGFVVIVGKHCLVVEAETAREALEIIDKEWYSGILEEENFKVYRVTGVSTPTVKTAVI